MVYPQRPSAFNSTPVLIGGTMRPNRRSGEKYVNSGSGLSTFPRRELRIYGGDEPLPPTEPVPPPPSDRPQPRAWVGPDGEVLGCALDTERGSDQVVAVEFVNGDRARSVRASLARGELPASD
jgi:hypothetical protein